MNDYSNYHGNPVLPPNYLGKAKFYNFIYKSSIEHLQKITNKWFNDCTDADVEFTPLSPYITITYSDYKSEKSLTPPFSNYGYVPYKECILSFFVVCSNTRLGIRSIKSVSAFTPYLFLDNIIPTILGREMYGMPKIYGGIDIDEKLINDTPISFSTEVSTLLNFSAETAATNQKIMSLEIVKGSYESEQETIDDGVEILKRIKQTLFDNDTVEIPSLGLLIEIGKFLFKKEMPFISMRQLRDIENPEKAVFQSIEEITFQVDKINHTYIIPQEYEINFIKNDLFPIQRDFGIENGQKSILGFAVDWEFLFKKGRKLF